MWTTVLLTVSLCISTVLTLMLCLCWRKKAPKDDLLGLHGMVTQKNPDENVNHLIPTNTNTANAAHASAAGDAHSRVVDGVNVVSAVVVAPASNNAEHCGDALKRHVAATNTRRSLPDIPSEQGAVGGVNWEPAGDNSSEHYATVGQYQNAKRHTLPNGIEARPSISQHSSMSQADDAFSPYEKVKYDKIKSKEHPYAQLQPSTSRQAPVLEESLTSIDERTNLLRVDLPSTSTTESSASSNMMPLQQARSRRSSTHSGGAAPSNNTINNNNNNIAPILDSIQIPAASAVAGGIAASPELPYMTPPVVVNQPNFSGDSQDSSKGYTSISVREPLANILAQTKEKSKKRELDPHYSTVSDDSDDVYTTIPDPNNSQIYTSESETYARIPAASAPSAAAGSNSILVEAEVNPVPQSSRSMLHHQEESHPSLHKGHNTSSNNPMDDDDLDFDDDDEIGDALYEPPPHPPLLPSVDSLKQVTAAAHHTHSRQASSSSSIGIVGSPKPEKRQANSPLPPPPSTSSAFVFGTEKIQSSKNLDDLYAKVQKHTKKHPHHHHHNPASIKDESDSPERSPEKSSQNFSNRRRSGGSPDLLEITSTAKNRNSSTCASPIGGAPPDQNMLVHHKRREHNYETLRKVNRQESDPGYEKIKKEEPGYASIHGPDSISGSDPGYEVLKQGPPSEIDDPNYEEVRHGSERHSSDASSDCAGYSKIQSNNNTTNNSNNNNNNSNNGNNNPSTSLDGYSVVVKKQKSDDKSRTTTSSSYTSNNFQDTLSIDEPNYESMPSDTASEHNYYAPLKGGTSADSESDPNYERVRDYEPPYERVTTSAASNSEGPSRNLELPGYERIAGCGYENIDTSSSSNGGGGGGTRISGSNILGTIIIGEARAPPYEQLVNDDPDPEIPGYEKINTKKNRNNNNSDNNNSSSRQSLSVKNDPPETYRKRDDDVVVIREGVSDRAVLEKSKKNAETIADSGSSSSGLVDSDDGIVQV